MHRKSTWNSDTPERMNTTVSDSQYYPAENIAVQSSSPEFSCLQAPYQRQWFSSNLPHYRFLLNTHGQRPECPDSSFADMRFDNAWHLRLLLSKYQIKVRLRKQIPRQTDCEKFLRYIFCFSPSHSLLSRSLFYHIIFRYPAICVNGNYTAWIVNRDCHVKVNVV